MRRHRPLAIGLALFAAVLAGCSQAPSGGSSLPLPSFEEADLSRVPEEPFRADATLEVSPPLTVAAGAGSVILAAAGEKGGRAILADGRSFGLPAGTVLAASQGMVVEARAPAGDGRGASTDAYSADGKLWSLPFAADAVWVSPGGARLAARDPASGKIVLAAGSTGRAIATFRSAPGGAASFAKGGTMLVSDPARLFLVDSSGKEAWSFEPTLDVERRAAISPDGAAFYVNTGDSDDTAYAFSSDAKHLLWKRQLPKGAASRWAVSADGARLALATGASGNDILLLRASDGAVLAAWSLPDDTVVRGMAFDRRGRLWTLLSPAVRATLAAEGIAAPDASSAGGPGARAVAWDEDGPETSVAVPAGALLAPDAAWVWSVDPDSGRIEGMRLANGSESSPAPSR